MERKEITMQLDVKLEAKEKNFELLNLRTWTKCFVKIEAVKCFPCYIKITFSKDSNDISKNNTVTRINLPGLHVQMAKSRTKNFAYGLFWNNNRKRCTAFFGFETKTNCEWHMKWLKLVIENLELHRQEILQSRRISRQFSNSTSVSDSENADASRDFLMYQNLHDTQDIKDVNDILGPLPNIPPFSSVNDSNWSRRVSGMSGIYEEIRDPHSRRQSGAQQLNEAARISIASGIYEEMRLPAETETTVKEMLESVGGGDEQITSTPPPLPPRTRVNTLESELPRSMTNPETETFEKYKCGELSRSNTKLHRCNDSIVVRRSKIKPKLLGYDFMDNKRNSYSSPDLTKFQQYSSESSIDLNTSLGNGGGIGSTNCSNSMSQDDDFVIDESDVLAKPAGDFDLNISEQIQSNFNFSCMNSSSVNLVGANVIDGNDDDDDKVVLRRKIVVKDDGGYCVMKRPAPSVSSGSEGSLKQKSLTCSSSTTESFVAPAIDHHQKIIDPCFDIQFRFDDVISTTTSIMSGCDELSSTGSGGGGVLYENLAATNHYVDMTRYKATNGNDDSHSLYDSPKRLIDQNNSAVSTETKILNRKSMTIDDKIPSYYPNENFKSGCGATKNTKTENVYITTPTMSGRKYAKKKTPPPAKLVNVSPARTSVVIVDCGLEDTASIKSPMEAGTTLVASKSCTDVPITTHQPIAQRIYQKYATLSRASSKYIEKCTKTSPKTENAKKFASLPRFRRIDLSPLKIKINSVLQRHNSEF